MAKKIALFLASMALHIAYLILYLLGFTKREKFEFLEGDVDFKLDEENIGKLMQFMMEACFVCGYLEEANPFDQEGVEVYKKEIVKRLEG